MDAVGVALGVSELLGRQRVPLLLVDGGVRVLAVHGQLGDVEERERHVGAVAVEDVPDHPHHATATVRAPVLRVLDHRRLVVAVAPCRAAPVLALAVGGRHAGEEDSCLVEVHVVPRPLQHVPERHAVRLLRRYPHRRLRVRRLLDRPVPTLMIRKRRPEHHQR